MLEKVNAPNRRSGSCGHRREFIGGSDARVIMGRDEKALIRLWQEKRGEIRPEDLSTNLIVQLGLATEDLNRRWYERNTGKTVTDVQCRVKHPVIRFMAATLDGVVAGTGAVYEAKFMLPWSFSEEGAAEKYMAQLQHNMWVTNARMAALSIITGGGTWVEISIAADPLRIAFMSARRGSQTIERLPSARGPHSMRPWNQPTTLPSAIAAAVRRQSSPSSEIFSIVQPA